MAEQEWFIDFGAGALGPFTPARLKELARSGQLHPETLVRTTEMVSYVPARRIKDLFAAGGGSARTTREPTTVATLPATIAARSSDPPGLPPPRSERPGTARIPPPTPQSSLPHAPDPNYPFDVPPVPAPEPSSPRWAREEPPPVPAPAPDLTPVDENGLPLGGDLFKQTPPPTWRSPSQAPASTVITTGPLAGRPVGNAPRDSATKPWEREPRRVKPTAPTIALPAPEWRGLWPLVALMLGLGWIVGGFLSFDRLFAPGAVWPVLLFAIGGVPAALAAIVFYLRPRRFPIVGGIGVALFTGVAGLLLLLLLQFLAAVAAHSHMGYGRGAAIWAIFAAIGTAYEWTNSGNILQKWIGFVFGVGLCEEATKLLPLALVILGSTHRKLGLRGFLILGFCSGLGFGIGEALYGYAPWNGNYFLGANIIRWYAAIPSHAVYTTICACFLWKLQEEFAHSEGWETVWVIAKAVGAMALLHGTYDTVCSQGVVAAMVVESLSFALLAWAVAWACSGEGEPGELPAMPWLEPLAKPALLLLTLGGATLLLLGGAAASDDRQGGIKAVLMAEAPAEIRPYVNGVKLGGEQPIRALFIIDVEQDAIVGRFTNTSAAAMNDLTVTCIAADNDKPTKIRLGELAPGATATVGPKQHWNFAPGEQVILIWDGHEAVTFVLP